MTHRTGSADLPLHGGRVPPWLADRMTRLGALITQAIILEYGRDEFLRRLSHPFWFQSFGAVMGMDWHSSGLTTAVLGALKRGIAPIAGELGLTVCGGRGRHSRATPDELVRVGDRTGLDGGALARTSRLVAKIDSAAVQDGFDLYLHGFVIADDGKWAVIQQGMNGDRGQARRYHWLSEGLTGFLDSPHAAVEGPDQGQIVNLADRRADRSRDAQLALLAEGPDRILRAAADLPEFRVPDPAQSLLPHLSMPGHEDVRAENMVLRRLHGAIAAAAEQGPKDFTDLMLVPKVGARTLLSLALVAEVVHGAPCRFSDPARFALAHGGKDRNPFPVPTKVFDHTIRTLKHALSRARLGQDERLAAIRRLDAQARALENAAGPDFATFIARERADSHHYGGRSVFGWERPPAAAGSSKMQKAFPLRAQRPPG
jgi:uncharacterized protein